MKQDTDKIVFNYREKLSHLTGKFSAIKPQLEKNLSKQKYIIIDKKFKDFHSKIYSLIFVMSLFPVLNKTGKIDETAIKEIEQYFTDYETFIQSVTKYASFKASQKTR